MKPRIKAYKGILLFIMFIALSGCGMTPDQESASATSTHAPVQTSPPSATPLPPIPEVTIDMILIPAGEFEMGGDADQALTICQEIYDPYYDLNQCGSNWFEDEEPIHIVYLDDYYIDKFEVTNADYQVCVEDGECNLPDKTNSYTREEYFGNPEYADYPVIYVNWYDAQTYCAWRGARLPTEAEWEKAARGTDGRIYPWGSNFDGRLGNFCGPKGENIDGHTDTVPVGSYPEGASPYGVMDMSGNVFEWTSDWYGYNYYGSSTKENPTGPTDGSQRVMRGSIWDCRYVPSVHITERFGQFPDYTYDYDGFRCATPSK